MLSPLKSRFGWVFWIVVGVLLLAPFAVVGLLRPRWALQLGEKYQRRLQEEQEALRTAASMAEFGADAARIGVLARHSEKLEALNAQQKEQAQQLMADPVALTRFLVRVGGTGFVEPYREGPSKG